MTYSSKLKDLNELVNCVDYAIVNDVNKDSILFVVDGLLEHYAKLSNGTLQIRLIPVDNIIDDSGLSSDELALDCDCGDVTLYDVLEEFSSLSPETLDSLRLRIELI